MKKQIIRSISALTCLLAVTSHVTASMQDPPSASDQFIAPDAVTVFENRARVHRRTEVELPIGSTEVVFSGLPVVLDPASVRARLSGVPGLVLGVRLEREFHEVDVKEKVRNLMTAIQQIDDQISTTMSEIEEFQRLQKVTARYAEILEDLISDVQQLSSQNSPGGNQGGRITTEQVIEAQQWITDRQLEHSNAIDTRNHQLQQLRVSRRDLQSDLDPLRNSAVRTSWTARVLIQASEAGTGSIELAHDIGGAHWVPIHEARLDESASTVKWISRAQVMQNSGEAWDDVKLTLSTARSSLGLAPPKLIPRRILARVVDQQNRPGVAVDSVMMDPREMEGAPASELSFGSRSSDKSEAGELLGAEILISGGPVLFSIRARASIPADGSVHTVTISEQVLAATLDYQAIPILNPHVFRRAKLVNTSEAPLLEGTVNCFREGSYVGDGWTTRIAAGESFSQHFGAEGRIVVRKEEIEDRSKEKGSFSKSVQLAKGYRITVDSVLDSAVSFELVERLPVSQVHGIEVELLDESDPQPEQDADGIVRWKVTLEPGSKNTFIFKWKVTADLEHADVLDQLR